MVGNQLNLKVIARLYQSGFSSREIAARFNTTHTNILQILDAAHINRRTKKEALFKHTRFNTCVVCGKVFRARENCMSTTNINRVTCSDDCQQALASVTHRKEIGHSPDFYQRRRQEFYPDRCHDCGTTRNIETHHIDRNKSNNTKKNIMPLCSQCHGRRHYYEDCNIINKRVSKFRKAQRSYQNH
jgi:hypothetical protein